MPTAKRWPVKLLLICLSLLCALLIAECGLRIIGYANPYFYTFEEQTGWMLRPGTAGWFRKEGRAYITINSAGMRDREHPKEKPAHTFRVAILGDSFAEALQVPVEQTFWHLLEAKLADCAPGRNIEVLNFGVGNYGTAQELITLRSRVWEYAPDLVLLIFTPGNDVRNNLRALDQDDLRPYFVYQGEQLVADMSFRASPRFQQKRTRLNNALYDAINHCRILQLLNAIRESRATQPKVNQQTTSGAAELGLDDHVYAPPQDKTWQEAWRVTEGLIAQINQETQAHGAKFMLVSLTTGIQTQPDPAGRQTIVQKLGVPDLAYPGQRVVRLGAREHFPVLDLAPDFLTYAQANQVPLHGFVPQLNAGHWNPAGHQLASELIARRLCGWLQQ